MNPYRLGNDHYYGSPLPAANPQNDRNNVLVDILNPGIPTVRSFLVSTVMEVVENYDVDAIHFDDYFYQQLYSSTGSILDEADQETFLMYPGNYNTSSTVDKANWRREQVNLLIEGISMAIKKYNAKNGKHVQFGISPTGIYRNGDGIITYDDEGKPITTGSATNGRSITPRICTPTVSNGSPKAGWTTSSQSYWVPTIASLPIMTSWAGGTRS